MNLFGNMTHLRAFVKRGGAIKKKSSADDCAGLRVGGDSFRFNR